VRLFTLTRMVVVSTILPICDDAILPKMTQFYPTKLTRFLLKMTQFYLKLHVF
jgi:hypothetical protein